MNMCQRLDFIYVMWENQADVIIGSEKKSNSTNVYRLNWDELPIERQLIFPQWGRSKLKSLPVRTEFTYLGVTYNLQNGTK